ncbi:MAG: acyltransferase family protein [Firmicutes bacterium]|nr:acyltransferase family protein [[Eubacterium] siraeum]MCM1487038.1 acyltransferase family protein [Bacillota bacterium]
MNKRNETLDIIRIFSLFCVVGVHFFLNSGFYVFRLEGAAMAVLCVFRSFFIICVPMFIMLSGYLMNGKAPAKKYFLGVTKVIFMYLISSVVFAAFEGFYLHREVSLKKFITDFLSYKGTTYAWYIEMYIGLYLLIPFLNMIFNNLKDQRQAKCLIAVLFAAVMLPSMTNAYDLGLDQWWLNPASGGEYFKLLPNWWGIMYPVFYYFLGAYVSKYKPKLSAAGCICFLLALVLADGFFNYWRADGASYSSGKTNEYASPVVAVIAYLTFALLLKIKPKKENRVRGLILQTLSDSCLYAYLLSAMFDSVFYKNMTAQINGFTDMLKLFPVKVLTVFSLSLCAGTAIHPAVTGVREAIEKLVGRLRKQPSVKL